jgi:hypothetical protein
MRLSLLALGLALLAAGTLVPSTAAGAGPPLPAPAAAGPAAAAPPGPTVAPFGAYGRRQAARRAALARSPSITDTLHAARVTFLGDSVMLGAEPALRQRFGDGALIDADVSRQYGAGLERLRELERAGALRQALVIHLGNNGTVTFAQLEETMRLVGDLPLVYLVTVRVPRKWEEPVNGTLRAATLRWPRVRLLDWQGYSRAQGLEFAKDGYHLRPEAARAYADLVAGAVAADLRRDPVERLAGIR